jgi:hypothetical protein
MKTSQSESLLYSRSELLLTNDRSWIHSLTGRLKGKPLLDMVGGVIEDYEFLWDQYYFPTATL